MLKNYILVAWRTLLRYKGYTLLNTLGLTLGLTCCLLIFQVVNFHTSFEKHHSKAGRVVEVVTETNTENGIRRSPGVPAPIGKALRSDYAFLEKVSMIMGVGNRLLTVPDQKGRAIRKFKEENAICFIEPDYFDILDYPWIHGSARSLAQPNTVVLTQKMAEKYFGSDDPRGKFLKLDNAIDLKVTGVVADIPENTNRRNEVFISWASMPKEWDGITVDNWGWTNSTTNCLLLFRNTADIALMNKLMPAFRKKYVGELWKEGAYPLIPLLELHTNPDFGGGSNTMLYVLASIGVFLLLTACINFVNLATAQALRRSKEVGVRKVIGGTRSQLLGQFLAETALITVLSAALAVGLAEILLPAFNNLMKEQNGMNFTGTFRFFSDPSLWAFTLALIVAVTLFAGAYPGFILAGFQPVAALKGKITTQQVGGLSVRRSLVVIQFVITQVLLISTLVVTQQMGFYRSKDIGYDPSAVLIVPVPSPKDAPLQTLRNRFGQVPGVESVSFCFAPPTSGMNATSTFRFGSRPENENWGVNVKPADHQYISTYGLKLVAGRNLSESDTTNGYVVNETFVKKIGQKVPDIVGQNLEVWGTAAPIVGVVRDFNNQSLRQEINPLAIFSNREFERTANIRVNTADLPKTIAGIEKIWNETFPEHLFEQSFLDERIARLYKQESLMLQAIRLFSFIAIFIGCLGLYGLVSFMAAQKTKEIGVRKVLGASLWQILGLFGGEFLRLMLLAFVVAAPLGGWAMSAWLSEFTFRIPMEWSVFAVSVALTGLIVLLTVGWKAFQAASLNPAKSLKTE